MKQALPWLCLVFFSTATKNFIKNKELY